MLAAIGERDPGTGHQILYGPGHQYLARAGFGAHACCDVNRDAGDVATPASVAVRVADQLDFAGVQPDPDLDPERAYRLGDGQGAADRAGGAVECGEHAVAERLDLAAPEPGELVAKHVILRVEEVAPSAVAHR